MMLALHRWDCGLISQSVKMDVVVKNFNFNFIRSHKISPKMKIFVPEFNSKL